MNLVSNSDMHITGYLRAVNIFAVNLSLEKLGKNTSGYK